VRTDSQTGDKIYSYSSGDAILSFWVRSSVVYILAFYVAQLYQPLFDVPYDLETPAQKVISDGEGADH
jgi:hypothetical protein